MPLFNTDNIKAYMEILKAQVDSLDISMQKVEKSGWNTDKRKLFNTFYSKWNTFKTAWDKTYKDNITAIILTDAFMKDTLLQWKYILNKWTLDFFSKYGTKKDKERILEMAKKGEKVERKIEESRTIPWTPILILGGILGGAYVIGQLKKK